MNQSLINNEKKSQRFNYIQYQDKFPLELNGKMKKRDQNELKSKQNMKDLINYSHCESSNQRKNQSNQINIRQCQKNSLTHKILSNKKLKNQNYEKSILPGEDQRSNIKRPESVKTYKETRAGTGVNYILAADLKNTYKHPQRKHVSQVHLAKRQYYGKKCNINISAYKNTESIQMRQNLNDNSQRYSSNQDREIMKLLRSSNTQKIAHKESTNKRVNKDIYSSIYRTELQIPQELNKVKFTGQNQFLRSEPLGYEVKHQKFITCQKITEIMGCTYGKKPQTIIRQKRDDWRRSAIILQ